MVQQRHALCAIDIAGVGGVPFGAVSGDKIVQIGHAAGFHQIAQAVPFGRINVKPAAAGRNILHHLGEFLPVRQADNVDQNAGLTLPQFLDAGGTGRKGLGQLADGPVRQTQHNAFGGSACGLHCLCGFDRAAFGGVGAVLVTFGARKSGGPADHAGGQVLCPGLPDKTRGDQQPGSVNPYFGTG